jgi:hypothetical protein
MLWRRQLTDVDLIAFAVPQQRQDNVVQLNPKKPDPPKLN